MWDRQRRETINQYIFFFLTNLSVGTKKTHCWHFFHHFLTIWSGIGVERNNKLWKNYSRKLLIPNIFIMSHIPSTSWNIYFPFISPVNLLKSKTFLSVPLVNVSVNRHLSPCSPSCVLHLFMMYVQKYYNDTYAMTSHTLTECRSMLHTYNLRQSVSRCPKIYTQIKMKV